MMEEEIPIENGSSFNGDMIHKKDKKEKKKKRAKHQEEEEEEENAAKSEKIRKKEKKRRKEKKESPTVSIAVAGSIIDNAQSLELATRLAGQIARAATIFRIEEVVVFDSKSQPAEDSVVLAADDCSANESGASFLVRILRYLETPQYLRRRLFPMHNSLKFVGLLPPLDAPHHVRKHEWSPYREGITLKEQPTNSKGTFVDVGLSKNVVVEQVLEAGQRVTVAMGTDRTDGTEGLKQVVPSMSPREELGLYWGYRVRYASNLSSVFRGSPYKGGYDHIIGTSEHGIAINSSELVFPAFRHLLIAFGGLGGLEESIEEDQALKGKNISQIFDSYLNICPHQGSRTIRTEEAIFISLQYFQEPIKRATQQYDCK